MPYQLLILKQILYIWYQNIVFLGINIVHIVHMTQKRRKNCNLKLLKIFHICTSMQSKGGNHFILSRFILSILQECGLNNICMILSVNFYLFKVLLRVILLISCKIDLRLKSIINKTYVTFVNQYLNKIWFTITCFNISNLQSL